MPRPQRQEHRGPLRPLRSIQSSFFCSHRCWIQGALPPLPLRGSRNLTEATGAETGHSFSAPARLRQEQPAARGLRHGVRRGVRRDLRQEQPAARRRITQEHPGRPPSRISAEAIPPPTQGRLAGTPAPLPLSHLDGSGGGSGVESSPPGLEPKWLRLGNGSRISVVFAAEE